MLKRARTEWLYSKTGFAKSLRCGVYRSACFGGHWRKAVVFKITDRFGSQLIERGLKSERGDHQIQFLPEGVVCRFSLPL